MTEKCLSFDGVDDKVGFGNILSFERTDSFSIEAWVKTAGATGAIVVKMGGSPYTGYHFGFIADHLRLSMISDYGNNNYLERRETGTAYTDDNWHYVVVTYDGTSAVSGVLLYADGSLLEMDDTRNSLSASIVAASELRMGLRGDNNADFAGLIDEVRISDKVRTTTEIADAWNGGNGVQFEVDEHTVALWHMNEGTLSTLYDETANDNDGTITGASWADGYVFEKHLTSEGDTGSGADASTLSEVFFSADSGVGLGALAALLAVINTSEVSSGCDRLRAKIESATTGGDMKLPPGGQASIPSRKVGI